jgi:hypothetical protein
MGERGIVRRGTGLASIMAKKCRREETGGGKKARRAQGRIHEVAAPEMGRDIREDPGENLEDDVWKREEISIVAATSEGGIWNPPASTCVSTSNPRLSNNLGRTTRNVFMCKAEKDARFEIATGEKER